MTHNSVRTGRAKSLALCATKGELEGEETAESAVAVGADDRADGGDKSAQEEGWGDANSGRRGKAEMGEQTENVLAGRGGGVIG